ncbi:MATE family efflux transporter [Pseudemcibacter aquimaris]|uniref:MATE family efflux transporter n=1 Tax=Pseudemcibacter aquimaris TaxID=2857064 RepID=UPI0020134C37|nr:MATE family efflux transporter [Pseudemcibacter aquimaris]MCC3861333.1 MATE family efflux transporter [Pseudemcibacter aquimaris]WDU58105.1 MATE family efflux transporter [Pseudemcibacter aquimaris]
MSDAAAAKPQKKSRRVDLTTGPVHKHLIRMALPMTLGIAASMSFTFVDNYFIAQLGTDEVAAMGFVTRVAMIIVAVSIGMGAGVTSVIARVAGNGDQDEIKKLATNTLILTFLVSIAVTIFGLMTVDPLFRAMGADDSVMPMIKEYIHIWYFTALFIIFPMTGSAIMRALGDTKLQGKIMLYSAFGNAVLDPLLIFGLYGFPELGLAGAAWASLITRFVSFAYILYSLQFEFHVICFKGDTLEDFTKSVRRIMHVGIPATGTNMIIPIVQAMIIALVATYGNNAVAATHLATTIEMLALVIFFALSAVVGPFLGQNLGANNFERIDECITKVMLFCLAFGAVSAVVLGLFATELAGLFRDEADIVNLARAYLIYVPISYGLYGMVMSVNAMFNAIGKPMPGVMISSLRVFFLQLPLFYFASQYYDLETAFIFISASNAIAGIVAYIWIKSAINKLRST